MQVVAPNQLRPIARGRRRGAILLEVVVGLSLVVVAAVFILDGLNTSLRSTRRASLEATAADLQVTITSFLQMGVVEMVNDGPRAFEDPLPIDHVIDPNWTWELVVSELSTESAVPPEMAPDLRQVQVVIRHEEEDYVLRSTRLMRVPPLEEEEEGADDDLGLPDGLPAGVGVTP